MIILIQIYLTGWVTTTLILWIFTGLIIAGLMSHTGGDIVRKAAGRRPVTMWMLTLVAFTIRCSLWPLVLWRLFR